MKVYVIMMLFFVTIGPALCAQPIAVSVDCPEVFSDLDLVGFVVTVRNISNEKVYIVGSSDNACVEYILSAGRKLVPTYEAIRDTTNLRHVNVLYPGEEHSFGVISIEPVTNGFGNCEATSIHAAVVAILSIEYYDFERWGVVQCPFTFTVRKHTAIELKVCSKLRELFVAAKDQMDFTKEMESLMKKENVLKNRFYGPYVSIGIKLETRLSGREPSMYERKWLKICEKYCSDAMRLVVREHLAWGRGVFRKGIKSFVYDE
jgi:hypothetical protein